MNGEHLLFEPGQLGSLTLCNRIVMAPLTRCRAEPASDAPTPLNAEYYRQRATAGLIIGEGSPISPQGKGYARTPGIFSEKQIEGWRLVTDAVHAQSGKIFIQLWHVGRISHPSLQPDGALPVAPSAIKPGGQAFTEQGYQDFVTPRALLTEEISGVVRQYREAAANAKRAGFDGAEIHAANGYLLDQFLRDGTNQRTDKYGGSVENRARLALEVVQAVAEVFGPDRVGIRLAPVSPVHGMSDSHPSAIFGYLIEALNRYNIAFIHMVEGITGGPREFGGFDFQAMRKLFKGQYIANNGYDRDLAIAALQSGAADFIAFGKLYIANPDLVERLRRNAPLNTPDQATFYGGGAKGYTDYPFLQDA